MGCVGTGLGHKETNMGTVGTNVAPLGTNLWPVWDLVRTTMGHVVTNIAQICGFGP